MPCGQVDGHDDVAAAGPKHPGFTRLQSCDPGNVLYCPGGHSLHDVSPKKVAYVPVIQRTQKGEPPSEYWPGGHCSGQDEIANVGPKQPGFTEMHLGEPGSAAYWPGGHGVHEVSPPIA